MLFVALAGGTAYFVLMKGPVGEIPPENVPSGAVIKSGVLEHDETWSGEILVTGGVIVPPGVTLTIEPGTVVMFKHYRYGYTEPKERLGMEISGKLMAVGTPENRIWFTSDAIDPCNGDWHMVKFINAENGSRIEYAIVEFGQQGINMWNSSPTISHTIVRWHNWEGIYLESYSKPLIEYCMVYQNGYNGIAMEQFNDAVLRYNMFSKSGTNGIHIDASRATIEHNVVSGNVANGISADDYSTVTVTYSTVENNGGAGVVLSSGPPTATLLFNTIALNNIGVRVEEASTLMLNFNNIYGNQGWEVINENFQLNVNAENNWWQTDGPGSGEISGNVDYSPWLVARITRNLTTGEEITSSIDFGYEDLKIPGKSIDYIPGDQLLDRYMYVYPDEDNTRRVVRKLGAGLGLTWSITWDGQYIWTTNLNPPETVYKLDPDTGDVIRSFPSPGPQPWGMTFDGASLWINDFAEKKVYEVDPNTGAVLSSFLVPDQEGGAKGMTWDGQYLYVMGWTRSVIWKLDRQGNMLEEIPIEGDYVGGLAWDGNYFWIPGGEKIHSVDRQGRTVGAINACSEGTWDLAWDPQHNWLWMTQRTNENWPDNKIFAVEILEEEVP